MNEKLSEQFQSREKKFRLHAQDFKFAISTSLIYSSILLPLVKTKPRIQIMFSYHYTAHNSAFITSNV